MEQFLGSWNGASLMNTPYPRMELQLIHGVSKSIDQCNKDKQACILKVPAFFLLVNQRRDKNVYRD